MITKAQIKGLLGLLNVVLLLVFMVFGDSNSLFWSSYYYVICDLIVMWLCLATVNTKDKAVRIKL